MTEALFEIEMAKYEIKRVMNPLALSLSKTNTLTIETLIHEAAKQLPTPFSETIMQIAATESIKQLQWFKELKPYMVERVK
tara:strand:+ start:864 stop:1106 length:243 start_codon:yes stop_codon:yes gene_type:complete